MKTSTIAERERLELIEKRVDIQKKQYEVRKEKLNMDELKLITNIANEEQKILIDKIASLKSLLADYTIDDERTIIGSEPFLKPIVCGREKDIVMSKLIDLVKQL
ncbi:MAG: hypothetical protein NTU43_02290 [Bacteroidetes bacterium]|nr:hypothetical protein [Bacteroidota bacterium]